MEQILHYRKRNFFCKSSKSREKENWNILIVWREVTEKCFLKILKIEPAVPGLIPSDKWCETDQFYSLPASNALWRKEINENRTSGENRKLASWFNLDLSLIGFFMTTKLQSGGYCIQWLVKIPLKNTWKFISLARERKLRENLSRLRLLSIPDCTVHTHKVSPQCDWLDESSDDKLDWMTSRIQHICTVSLQCALTCDPSVCRLDWIMCYIQYTLRLFSAVSEQMSPQMVSFAECLITISTPI